MKMVWAQRGLLAGVGTLVAVGWLGGKESWAQSEPKARSAAEGKPVAPGESAAAPQPEEAAAQPGPQPTAGPPPAPFDYNLRLRDLEERVNQLKEKIFLSKARLIQLQEVVLHGTIAGAKAVLVHRNEMGSSFRLEKVVYHLDGAPIFDRVDSGDGELDAQEEVEIFSGNIAPGKHQISVLLEYRGHGYGVFRYLEAYKFEIKSSFAFEAEEGQNTTIRIVAFEKGSIITPLNDRPAVRYDVTTRKEQRVDAHGHGVSQTPARGSSQ